jgi:hypothetical protein
VPLVVLCGSCFRRASLAQRDVPVNGVGYECQITPRTSSNLTYKTYVLDWWFCVEVVFVGHH